MNANRLGLTRIGHDVARAPAAGDQRSAAPAPHRTPRRPTPPWPEKVRRRPAGRRPSAPRRRRPRCGGLRAVGLQRRPAASGKGAGRWRRGS